MFVLSINFLIFCSVILWFTVKENFEEKKLNAFGTIQNNQKSISNKI